MLKTKSYVAQQTILSDEKRESRHSVLFSGQSKLRVLPEFIHLLENDSELGFPQRHYTGES